MIAWGSNTKVYLATGATDMRKAINGLIVLVEDALQADPFSSHLFVFCNRLRFLTKNLFHTCHGTAHHCREQQLCNGRDGAVSTQPDPRF